MDLNNSLILSDPVKKLSFEQWLFLSSAFSCLLLFARIIVTGTGTFLFLPWNLFLGFLPYLISNWITRDISVIKNKVKLFLVLLVWLLFIPNSFYIITDLFHLVHIDTAPRWFDLLLIFSFAWNGILFGVISMNRVEFIVSLHTRKRYSFFFIILVMWLCAFGIYIGRFLRFNSWDVITDPFSLAAEILDMLLHPFQNGYAWGMTILYSIFMSFLYISVKKLGESFAGHKK
jgi:uncharacterized membrane protein